MKQKPIKTVGDALSRVDAAIGAATQYGEGIGLKHNTATLLTTDRTNLVTKNDAYSSAKTEMTVRRTTLNLVVLLVFAFVVLTRDVLKRHLGTQYSIKWEGTGFEGSLKTPRDVTRLKLVLERLVTYLTNNPTKGSVDLGVTAARAQESLNDLKAAETAVLNHKKVVDDAKNAKDTAFEALRKRIAALFKELLVLLHPTDGVFLSFGFNKPGAVSLPEVPANVIVTLVGGSAASVKWEASARAERYRVWTKVVGVDTEPVLAATREELDYVIEGLPSGTTLEITVSAINDGGESERSAVITITTA